MGRWAIIKDNKVHWIHSGNKLPVLGPTSNGETLEIVDISERPEVQEGWVRDVETGTLSEPSPPAPEYVPQYPMSLDQANALLLARSFGLEIGIEQEAQIQEAVVFAAGIETVASYERNWITGEFVSVGCKRAFSNIVYKCRQSHITQAGWEPPNVPALWVVSRDDSGPLEWVAGEPVYAGEIRLFGGVEFEVVQSHVTQVGWEPPNVPALWRRIS